MTFDRIMRVLWLLFAMTVFTVWCSSRRIRTMYVQADVGSASVELSGNVGNTLDGTVTVKHQ